MKTHSTAVGVDCISSHILLVDFCHSCHSMASGSLPGGCWVPFHGQWVTAWWVLGAIPWPVGHCLVGAGCHSMASGSLPGGCWVPCHGQRVTAWRVVGAGCHSMASGSLPGGWWVPCHGQWVTAWRVVGAMPGAMPWPVGHCLAGGGCWVPFHGQWVTAWRVLGAVPWPVGHCLAGGGCRAMASRSLPGGWWVPCSAMRCAISYMHPHTCRARGRRHTVQHVPLRNVNLERATVLASSWPFSTAISSLTRGTLECDCHGRLMVGTVEEVVEVVVATLIIMHSFTHTHTHTHTASVTTYHVMTNNNGSDFCRSHAVPSATATNGTVSAYTLLKHFKSSSLCVTVSHSPLLVFHPSPYSNALLPSPALHYLHHLLPLLFLFAPAPTQQGGC